MSDGSGSGEDEGHIPNPKARFLAQRTTPLQKPRHFGLPPPAGFLTSAGFLKYELFVWGKGCISNCLDGMLGVPRIFTASVEETHFLLHSFLFTPSIHGPLVSSFPQHA